MNNRVKGLLIAFLSMGASWAMAQNNTFPTTGNVGIGTTSPTKKLDVEGVVKGNEFGFPFVGYNFDLGPRTQLGPMSIKLFDDYVTTRPGGPGPGSNYYGTLMAIYGRGSHWQTDIYFGASDLRMYFRTSAYVTNSSENGVGQFNNWRTLLDSHSDVKSSGKLLVSGNGNHVISNGNVGIGTDTPAEKLAVNGNIRAKEIKVETSNWPDYVFEEDYPLKPLSEVEQFVKLHKHLPDIPSAKQVEADGVALGEMNKLLLKKVEELTLHLILKEKKEEAYDQRLKEMEKRLQILESN